MFKFHIILAKKVQRFTETLPPITVTETHPAIASISTVVETVAAVAETLTHTSIEVFFI